MVQSFPRFDARGSHRQLGRGHGDQARAQIRGFLDYLQKTLALSRSQLRERALRFRPLFERHCPHLVEEVHGLAEGADVPFADALAVQVRGELGQVSDGGCTTFAVSGRGTADGHVLIGQNSDMEPEIEAYGYVLGLYPEDRPAVLMWTFGGMIGYHGVNATGVAHFANSLGGGPAWRFGLPHYPVKRMMLERDSLAGVLDLLRSAPVCSSGNYVLCEGGGRVADVEITPTGFEVIDGDGPGWVAHSNHFLCGAHACPANHAASLADSFPRLDRMRELISGRFGALSVADFKAFLADHAGGPAGICRHPNDGPIHPTISPRGRTVAALVADPAAGRLHVARGNPCTVPFAVYQLA